MCVIVPNCVLVCVFVRLCANVLKNGEIRY